VHYNVHCEYFVSQARILLLLMRSNVARYKDPQVCNKLLPRVLCFAVINGSDRTTKNRDINIEFRDVNKRLQPDETDSVWIVKGGAWAVANNCLLLSEATTTSSRWWTSHADAPFCRVASHVTRSSTAASGLPNQGSCFAYQKLGVSHKWRKSVDTDYVR